LELPGAPNLGNRPRGAPARPHRCACPVPLLVFA